MNNIDSWVKDVSLPISFGGMGLAGITVPLIIYLRNRINDKIVELETLANEKIENTS